MKDSQNELENACGALADYLQAHKETLVEDWLEQTRKDSGVPSEALSRLELEDHVPNIFDAIIRALRQRCSDAAMDDIQEVAARHTIVRWVQSYDLKAVLREVSLLRSEFIRSLRVFDDAHPHFAGDARILNDTIVHRILDDIVADATDTFFKLRAHADRDDA